MHIHNYFSDVLKSITYLFDNYIFEPETITHYEFNIANRAFSLFKNDYRPNFEFPNAIITLNEDQFIFGERSGGIQRLLPKNFNQIEVLHDENTGRKIFLQEDQVTLGTTVQINCESQLQAKNLEFRIKRFLPITKYIQIIGFTTFLQISSHLLKSLDFDWNTHNINNLFIRYDKSAGKFNQYFSVYYKPIIRLENSTTNIADSVQRSFTINLDISFLLQLPIFIYCEKDYPVIENINIDFNKFNEEPITENTMKSILGNENDTKRPVIRNLIIHSEDDYEIIDENIVNLIVRSNKEDFVFDTHFQYRFHGHFGNVYDNIKPNYINVEENYVTFEFKKSFWDEHLKPSVTHPIILQIIEPLNDLE